MGRCADVNRIHARAVGLVRRRKNLGGVLVASSVALAAIGVSATAAIGNAEDPAPVAATAAERGRAVPASVERAATNPDFAAFGVRPGDAVEVPSPPAADTSQAWFVVPADRGACMVPGNGALVCGTVEQLEAGQILFLELPLRPLAETPGPLVDATNPIRIAGLVPDGVSTVIATGEGNRELGRAAVESNVYEIALNRASASRSSSSALETLELRGPDGTARATLHVGGE